MAYMKCGSHRARSRLKGLIGKEAQCFYSLSANSFHGVFWVPEDLVEKARTLRGITKTRQQDPDLWLRCW